MGGNRARVSLHSELRGIADVIIEGSVTFRQQDFPFLLSLGIRRDSSADAGAPPKDSGTGTETVDEWHGFYSDGQTLASSERWPIVCKTYPQIPAWLSASRFVLNHETAHGTSAHFKSNVQACPCIQKLLSVTVAVTARDTSY